MSGFGDFDTAMKARDTLTRLMINVLDRERPAYKYGTVISIDPDGRFCMVRFPGGATDGSNDVKVRIGAIAPRGIGTTVRVAGYAGDKFISDVLGKAVLTTTISADLPVPTGVVLTVSPQQATLDWNDMGTFDTPVDSYEVEFAESADFVTNPRAYTTTSSLFQVPYNAGTTVWARVRSLNGTGGSSGWAVSAPASAVVPDFPAGGTDGSVPPIGNAPVITTGLGFLFANWVPVVNVDLVTYEVHISTVSGFTPSSATLVGETMSTGYFIDVDGSDTKLVYGTTYFVRIVPKDGDGAGPASPQASGVPQQLQSSDVGNVSTSDISDGTPPTSSPAGPTLVSGIGYLYAKWSLISNPDTVTYEVHVSTTSGFIPDANSYVGETNSDFIFIRTQGAGTGFAALAYGVTYYVKLWAKDQDGYAPNAGTQSSSATLQVTNSDVTTISGAKLKDGTPPASSPAATVTGGLGYLFVNWTPVANNDPVIYEVHLSTTSGFTPGAGTKIGETSGTTAVIRNLPGTTTPLSYGTTYYVRLVAKDLDGSAAAGAQGSASIAQVTNADLTTISGAKVKDGTPPASSPTPSVVNGIGALYVFWTAVANADPVTYEVHLSASSGFTPGSGTKVSEVTDTYTVIRNLPGGTSPLAYGTTYYVKLIAKDADGSAAAGTQASGVPQQTNTADIAANAITATQIAANAVTAAKILAGTITASQIAANTLTAGLIAAGAVTADKLSIGVTTSNSLVANGGFEDADTSGTAGAIAAGWVTAAAGSTSIASAAARSGLVGLRCGASGSWAAHSVKYMPVSAGDVLTASVWACTRTAPAGVYLRIHWYDSTGTQLSSTDVMSAGNPPLNVWTQYIGQVTAPANAVQCAISLFNTQGAADFDDVDLRKVLQGVQIANGTVTATQIAAGTITATQIAAGTVTATQIAAGSITGDRLQANTITAAQIATDTITATQIAANAITATELAAGAVTASKLLVTVGGGNLLANSSFAVDLSQWSTNNPAPINITATRDTARSFYGPASVRIDVTNNGAGPGTFTATTPPLQPNVPIAISAYFYLTAALPASINPSIDVTGPGSFDSANFFVDNTKLNQWQRVSGTVTPTTAGAHTFRLVVGQSTTAASFWMSAVQVEVGDVATAYAPKVDEILPGTIVASMIAAGTITGDRIAGNTITAANLVAGTITAASGIIADAAIATAKIQDGAISTAKIGDAQITTAKIADLQVTSGKINDLVADKITAGLLKVALQITTGKLTTGGTGARVDLDSTGLKGYNSGGTVTFTLDAATGNVTLETGATLNSPTVNGGTLIGTTVETAASGTRAVMDSTGVSFYQGASLAYQLTPTQATFYGSGGNVTIIPSPGVSRPSIHFSFTGASADAIISAGAAGSQGNLSLQSPYTGSGAFLNLTGDDPGNSATQPLAALTTTGGTSVSAIARSPSGAIGGLFRARVQDSGGTLHDMTFDGATLSVAGATVSATVLRAGNDTGSSQHVRVGITSAGNIGAVIKAASGQTSSMAEFRDINDAVMSRIDQNGRLLERRGSFTPGISTSWSWPNAGGNATYGFWLEVGGMRIEWGGLITSSAAPYAGSLSVYGYSGTPYNTLIGNTAQLSTDGALGGIGMIRHNSGGGVTFFALTRDAQQNPYAWHGDYTYQPAQYDQCKFLVAYPIV